MASGSRNWDGSYSRQDRRTWRDPPNIDIQKTNWQQPSYSDDAAYSFFRRDIPPPPIGTPFGPHGPPSPRGPHYSNSLWDKQTSYLDHNFYYNNLSNIDPQMMRDPSDKEAYHIDRSQSSADLTNISTDESSGHDKNTEGGVRREKSQAKNAEPEVAPPGSEAAKKRERLAMAQKLKALDKKDVAIVRTEGMSNDEDKLPGKKQKTAAKISPDASDLEARPKRVTEQLKQTSKKKVQVKKRSEIVPNIPKKKLSSTGTSGKGDGPAAEDVKAKIIAKLSSMGKEQIKAFFINPRTPAAQELMQNLLRFYEETKALELDKRRFANPNQQVIELPSLEMPDLPAEMLWHIENFLDPAVSLIPDLSSPVTSPIVMPNRSPTTVTSYPSLGLSGEQSTSPSSAAVKIPALLAPKNFVPLMSNAPPLVNFESLPRSARLVEELRLIDLRIQDALKRRDFLSAELMKELSKDAQAQQRLTIRSDLFDPNALRSDQQQGVFSESDVSSTNECLMEEPENC